jgi:hypothetical protein
MKRTNKTKPNQGHEKGTIDECEPKPQIGQAYKARPRSRRGFIDKQEQGHKRDQHNEHNQCHKRTNLWNNHNHHCHKQYHCHTNHKKRPKVTTNTKVDLIKVTKRSNKWTLDQDISWVNNLLLELELRTQTKYKTFEA